MTRVIRQGQFVAPIHAAEAYIGAQYTVEASEGYYSANPADYWNAADSAPLGRLWRERHEFRTNTGRTVYASRLLKSAATVGDLRRLARAATNLVRGEGKR